MYKITYTGMAVEACILVEILAVVAAGLAHGMVAADSVVGTEAVMGSYTGGTYSNRRR